MKKWLFFLCLTMTLHASAGDFVIEFTYEGKNVFLSNPMRANGTFCGYTIIVNGKDISTNLSSSNIEIDLDEMGFKIGDPIKIVITHHDDCKPVLLSEHH